MATKKPSTKRAAKKAAKKTAKKATKAAGKKGKRYTDAEKQAVIDFVNSHNAAKGRGGAAAASRKFKVSQLTIGAWLKKSGKKPGRAVAVKKVARARATSGGSRSSVLAQLSKLDAQIAAKRKELDALESKFASLKAGL